MCVSTGIDASSHVNLEKGNSDFCLDLRKIIDKIPLFQNGFHRRKSRRMFNLSKY